MSEEKKPDLPPGKIEAATIIPIETNPLHGFVSEKFEKITEAFAKAQGQFELVVCDCVNPHFKSKYASKSSIIKATTKALSENGLVFTQLECGQYMINLLMHTSGQWYRSKTPIVKAKQDAHGHGAGLTYAERFGMKAMLRVAIEGEDDDGNGASGKGDPPKDKKPPPRKPTDLVNNQELRRLFTVAGTKDISPELMKQFFNLQYGYTTSKQLTNGQWSDVMKMLTNKQTDENTVALIVDGLNAEKEMEKQNQSGATSGEPTNGEVPF